jgi:hypothetical protein
VCFDKDRYDIYEKALNLTDTPESETKQIVSGLSLMRDFAGELFAKYSNHSAYTAYLLCAAGNRDELLDINNLAALRQRIEQDHAGSNDKKAAREKFNQIVSIMMDTTRLSSSWQKFMNTQKVETNPTAQSKESLYSAVKRVSRLKKSKGMTNDQSLSSGAENQYLTEESRQDQRLEAATHDRMQAEITMKQLWQQPMNMLDLNDLLRTGHNVGLSTIFMESVNTLNMLNNTRYDTPEAYELAYKSEALLAPLCEIIGFDGLAMALRSKVICLQLRNTGKGHFVDLAEQILSELGVLGAANPEETITAKERNQNYGTIVHRILKSMVGDIDSSASYGIELILGRESDHDIVIGNGDIITDLLRLVFRLKSVGSLAQKLAEWAEKAEKQHETERQNIQDSTLINSSLEAYNKRRTDQKNEEKNEDWNLTREYIRGEMPYIYNKKVADSLLKLIDTHLSELYGEFNEITPKEVSLLDRENKDNSVEIPFDILGMTLIAKDRASLVDIFFKMVDNSNVLHRSQDELIQDNQLPAQGDEGYDEKGYSVTPHAAPSRDEMLKVEGRTEFINYIKTKFKERYFNIDPEQYIKFKEENKKDFHVSKITGLYEDHTSGILPFEIQVLTEKDRQSARYGVAAHILYKLSKQLGYRLEPTKKQLASMSALNGRKKNFGKRTVNKASYRRIKKVNKAINDLLNTSSSVL